MAVVDNNILSSLAKINRLEILDEVFEDVITTTSVLDELHKDELSGADFVDRIDKAKKYNDGWLKITSLTEQEIQKAEKILDSTLSFTDAECISIAETRNTPLVTDDGHVGETALQRNIEVWDLKLLFQIAIKKQIIKDKDKLNRLIQDLQKKDYYKFSEKDKEDLYKTL